jgi:hypothetical protein
MSLRAHPRLLALPATLLVLLSFLVLASGAHAQATRTWVSGVGDDVNPCSRTAPCKTFAGAISKTASGGMINAIDPAGYGAVTITKPITIDGTGTQASVLNAGGVSGVVVNMATPGPVTLRGLDINAGGTPSGCGATVGGVRILSASSVRMEDVRIGSQPSGAGVIVAPSTGNTDVLLNHVAIGDTCGAGVSVEPTAGATADVTVRDTAISGTASGLRVADGGRAWLAGSSITGNEIGLERVGAGQIFSYFGTNQIHGNDVDGTPTAVIGDAPIGIPGPAGPVGPQGAPGPLGPAGKSDGSAAANTARCTVPKLIGLTRAKAVARLKAADCAAGTVKRRRGAKKLAGRVVAQSRKAGTSLPAGAKVGLTVGRTR